MYLKDIFFYPCISGIPVTCIFDYIYDKRSWERWYVSINIIFPCLRVLCLADINYAVIGKVYYYSRMTKQCADKTVSDIDYQKLFPEINSTANIWNMFDDKVDEEES